MPDRAELTGHRSQVSLLKIWLFRYRLFAAAAPPAKCGDLPIVALCHPVVDVTCSVLHVAPSGSGNGHLEMDTIWTPVDVAIKLSGCI